MDGLSFDQIVVFLAVVDQGSFSAAARHLDRAQSAVTYAVQKLEEQVGAPLFDRSTYRPVLTEAGRALLPGARRVAAEVRAFHAHARGLHAGLEPELSLAVDSMFPMCGLLAMMKAFSEHFPSIPTRIYVESLGSATRLVLDKTCVLGLLSGFAIDRDELKRVPLERVELVPVVAPGHPLAKLEGPIATEWLQDYVQLVLTDRSQAPAGPDHGVLSLRTWRLGDLGAKHAMLKAGLGWGGMPIHMIRDDLAAGRLQKLNLIDWGSGGDGVMMTMWAACRRDAGLGLGAQWLFKMLGAGIDAAATREAVLPLRKANG